MKQSNRDCKIVRDLLPNYIENLTDEVTNEYINEHIAKCHECAQALKDMNGEIKLEVINQDKEIKYLKKVKRRVKQTIALVSLIVIIVASCIIGYVYEESKVEVNNYTFLKGSYAIENNTDSKDGYIYCTLIGIFDEKGKCCSVRVLKQGYTEKYLYEIEEKKSTESFMNYEIYDDELHYNINMWNGYTKEEVIEYWKKDYNVQDIKYM